MKAIPLPFDLGKLLLIPQWPWMDPVLRVVLFVLLCGVPLGLMVWLYRYELRLVPRVTATALLALRVVVLALILFLVCLQPVHARDRTEGRPGFFVVAVDRSDSMDVADPQRETLDKLRLARALHLHEGLCDNARLDGWIRDYEKKRDPQWVAPNESLDDAGRRARLEAERRKAHDQICERIDKLTRTQAARRVLGEEGVGLLPTLAGKHKVELLGFTRGYTELQPNQLAELFRLPDADKAGPEGKKAAADAKMAASFTDLRLPLARALERSASGQAKILGVVLLTDGQHNTGEPPNKKARELGERGVPVYPIMLGARKAPPDVAVISVKAPDRVFKDVDVAIDVRFKVTGLAAQDVEVELYRVGKEDKPLARRTIRHQGKDHEYAETFSVRMDEVGSQALVARVRPANRLTKETRTDNNSRAATIDVANDKAKVLLIDGEARWENHYLASALKRDRTMDVTNVVFLQPRLNDDLTPEQLEKMGSPRQKLPAGPDALAPYDCIILGDVLPEQLPLAERQRLEKYVANRGGTLVILAGKRAMPLGYPEDLGAEADPLRKLLPIEAARVVKPAEGFGITLTQAGKGTKFMELDPELGRSPERWAQMPPHYWGIVGHAKPGATPLAYLPDGIGDPDKVSEREKRNALIVRQNYGFGRVLFVGLDSTWRWRFKVGDTYHHRFWGQAIRWAAADKPLVAGNEYLRFGPTQAVYRQGQEVEIITRLSEGTLPSNTKPRAWARILRLGGPKEKEEAVAQVPLSRRPAQPLVLQGQLRDLGPGQYAIELAIPDLAGKLNAPPAPPGSPDVGKPPRPLRATFRVEPPDSRETVDLNTNRELLNELAIKSGGKVFTPEDAGELAKLLASKSIPHVEHNEQRLYQWWPLLAAVVLLLSGEWVIRKLAGLP